MKYLHPGIIFRAPGCPVAHWAVYSTGAEFHKSASDAVAFGGKFPYIGIAIGQLRRTNRETHRMTTFNDRENAFENLFAHNSEMQFKAEARRNKLLGLWAAEKMGLAGDAAAAYAKTVVIADLEEAGDDDVFRKVAGDIAAKGIAIPDTEIRRRMQECLTEAKAQIAEEAGA
jgi:hypothetical protein